MENFRLLVTGSRSCQNEGRIRKILLSVFKKKGENVTLVSGNARGADRICEKIAEEFGWTIEKHPADWEKYGKSAGFVRNREMVLSKPDLALAFFPGSTPTKGTQLTIDLCEKHQVPLRKFPHC